MHELFQKNFFSLGVFFYSLLGRSFVKKSFSLQKDTERAVCVPATWWRHCNTDFQFCQKNEYTLGECLRQLDRNIALRMRRRLSAGSVKIDKKRKRENKKSVLPYREGRTAICEKIVF
jgi:hypothetical protein